LASTVQRDGLRLIAVVMGVPQVRGHFAESIKIYNYGFAKYMAKEFAPAGSKQGEVIVHKGSKPMVEIVAESAVAICVEKGKDKNCWTEVKFDDPVNAPVKAGQKLGEIIIFCGQEELSRVPLVAKESIEKAGILELIKRTIQESYTMKPSIYGQ
jgi:D-alanyl-D-alanine carboxypeptidase (penicillin-binding protein 5/6)